MFYSVKRAGYDRGHRSELSTMDRAGAAAERSFPTPEIRGGGQEQQPHLQGEAAAQEGHEELLHVQGQEGRP